MRKTALGVVLALMLAAIPVTLFATSAVADANSDVRVIWIDQSHASNIIIDNAVAYQQLQTAHSFDTTLGVGVHTIVACDDVATQFDGSDCLDVGNDPVNGPWGNNPFTDNVSIDTGGANYTVVLNEQFYTETYTFVNNQNTTAFNRARFQLNNASASDIDVCIDSHDGNGVVPFLSNIAGGPYAAGGGGQDSRELTAVQGATVYIGVAGDSCTTFSNFDLNFPAGTNTVFTATNSGDFGVEELDNQPACGAACIQVLFVGEDTHPNNPDAAVFCANIANLAGVQSGLKALVGDVDPTSTESIAATQPSAGDMQAFVDSTNGTLTLGDESVTPIVAQSWATATAGLRALLHTFELVGYDLSALPPSAVEQIVLGANGVKLPGVPVDTDVVGAQEALSAFYSSVCAAAPAPTPTPTPTPTPAPTPVAANARFTG